jgi:type VI protein secretion system component Hcp
MIANTSDQEACMSEQRESHDTELEDLEVTPEEAKDVKGGDGVVSPRDPASGLPTGKRSPTPIVITKQIDKSTPSL